MVFNRTSVTQGTGRAIVTSTGMGTQVGKIADLLQATEDDETPLVKGQDIGAPATFRPKRILLQMTIVASIGFVLYYIAYVNGWADPDVLSGRA